MAHFLKKVLGRFRYGTTLAWLRSIRRSVGRVFESKSGERKTERTMTEVRIVIFIRN